MRNLPFQSSGSQTENPISAAMTPVARQCAAWIGPGAAVSAAIRRTSLRWTSGSRSVASAAQRSAAAAGGGGTPCGDTGATSAKKRMMSAPRIFGMRHLKPSPFTIYQTRFTP
jgi:hypothetical protein